LVIEASDQLIVTSGTAVLEVALHKKPQLLAIKIHPISYWIMKKLIKTKWVGLPNILAQKEVVKEFIQSDASVDNIHAELELIISDQDKRNQQIKVFSEQHKMLKQNASEVAASTIECWLKAQ
ncbi:MAG TPA: lipid-A-disaccharide synthase, partial [Thiomicrospira sp.]|nr:lipid-A-disaccharide synthase [Thiomicrospira sp.]